MDIFNPFTLKGKTILVTGASSGIGRGIAIACSKMGASVIINGRNEQRLAETLREMRGEENFSLIADLSQIDAVAIMVRQLPKLDGVVHCAGIGQRILCKQLQESDLDNMMDVNFKAPVMFQTELLRQKKINKGASIVFIASIAYIKDKKIRVTYTVQCFEVEKAVGGGVMSALSNTRPSISTEKWPLETCYPFIEKDEHKAKKTSSKALVMTHAYSNVIMDKIEEAVKNGLAGNESDNW